MRIATRSLPILTDTRGPYFGAFFPGERPRWFKVEYGDAYFLKQHYERGFRNTFRASGGNMFVRRDVFDALRFDVAMGLVGAQLKLGEETDMQERYLSAQPRKGYRRTSSHRTPLHFAAKLRLSYAVSARFRWDCQDPAESAL